MTYAIAYEVSTHSRAEAAAFVHFVNLFIHSVSTHSRAEAAAKEFKDYQDGVERFNTQPRRGGCLAIIEDELRHRMVSTHSRAEAAAPYLKKQEKSAD